jgi:hypothetical protein
LTVLGWRENQAASRQSTVLATPKVCMTRMKASNGFIATRLEACRQSAVA